MTDLRRLESHLKCQSLVEPFIFLAKYSIIRHSRRERGRPEPRKVAEGRMGWREKGGGGGGEEGLEPEKEMAYRTRRGA